MQMLYRHPNTRKRAFQRPEQIVGHTVQRNAFEDTGIHDRQIQRWPCWYDIPSAVSGRVAAPCQASTCAWLACTMWSPREDLAPTGPCHHPKIRCKASRRLPLYPPTTHHGLTLRICKTSLPRTIPFLLFRIAIHAFINYDPLGCCRSSTLPLRKRPLNPLCDLVFSARRASHLSRSFIQ
jgi:hypothetical protein